MYQLEAESQLLDAQRAKRAAELELQEAMAASQTKLFEARLARTEADAKRIAAQQLIDAEWMAAKDCQRLTM